MDRNWGKGVALYLALTFGIAWGILAVFLAFPAWFESAFGPVRASSPAFYLAVWAPNIAAVIVTVARVGRPGFEGAGALLLGAILGPPRRSPQQTI